MWKVRKRVVQIRARTSGNALLVTSAFSTVELALSVALLSLIVWFTPGSENTPLLQMFLSEEQTLGIQLVSTAAYAVVVLFLEPFYVAAGFGMYLNRRVELEAWDIEQEFRRAFAH